MIDNIIQSVTEKLLNQLYMLSLKNCSVKIHLVTKMKMILCSVTR